MLASLLQQMPAFLTVPNIRLLLQALGVTLSLSLIGGGVGLVAGFLLALLRCTSATALLPLRVLTAVVVEAFRRVPFLVTLMLFFFGTQALGLDLPLFTVAVCAISLIAACFMAEIVRTGIESVHPTQWQAAAVMNLRYATTLRMVVLPQAMRTALPAAVGYLVLLIKDTALASQIGVVELTQAAKSLGSRGYAPELVYGAILILYFVVSYPLARLGGLLEVRFGASRRR